MSGNDSAPSMCLEPRPKPNSVQFSGQFINLSHLGFRTGITVSHLSMIFGGKRQPSLKNAKKIADALAMAPGQFIEALDEHVSVKKIATLLRQE
ncbi:MAG: helix-turn-helix transcriptional regulator [Candidatus Acidiferrales bacterium]